MDDFWNSANSKKGSAVKALGQPTPLGDGPMGFFHVINDAIITTEKVSQTYSYPSRG